MTDDAPDTAAARKARLRRDALARRDGLEIDDRLLWDAALCERALALLDEILAGSILSPHPEERASARVSKDAPGGSGASTTILRDAISDEMAPQDEGYRSEEGFVHGHRLPCVSAYWPMRSEADPRPILESLHAQGVPLCLPAIVERRMLFRRWAPYEPIVPGGFGTLVPGPAQPEIAPSILLVPLAAFDRRGYRIGYGKGHYDAALTALSPAIAIGLAYASQEIAAVPDEPHDRRLDWVVTETETIRCGVGAG